MTTPSTNLSIPLPESTEKVTRANYIAALNAIDAGAEPVIATKGTAFNKSFGTASDTVCQGNDSRLSNARTPTAHTHDTIYLNKTNTDEFTPIADYHPATKKYVDDTSGGSGGAETWTTVDSFTRASDSSYTVTDNAANQAIHAVGRPIRYADTAGTYSYGIITGYTTGTVTLAGAPMTTSFDAILEYGDFTRVVPLEVIIPSTFASAGASSTLINTVLKADLAWRMGKAYLVRFLHIVEADDSGANQTRVNVNVAGSAVGTANANAGPAIAETWVATTSDINISNYDINLGEAIEITCDANGTNDNAANLTVSMTFVLA